jgi:hypothetical protein
MIHAPLSNRAGSEGVFIDACLRLGSILNGPARDEIVTDICRSKNLPASLLLLRRAMRSNSFKTRKSKISLDKVVKGLDAKARDDGFNVLHDWDGKADKLNQEIIPVDVLNYALTAGEIGNTGRTDRKAPAVLLDYYFVYLLALLSLRIWDEGGADENLDRLNHLLELLHGSGGSGHRFVSNAETLILIATSHYEPDEKAYEKLLTRVLSLNPAHRLSIALVHAGVLGCHLRYGLDAQYGRDIVAMRRDNVPDYAWLCIALATLIRAYSRIREKDTQGTEREYVVEGILNALSADARSFIGKPTGPLAAAYDAELSQFSELFRKYRQDLFREFERHRPSDQGYAPLALRFNFPHNVLKGTVIDALFSGESRNLCLNDLLTGIPQDIHTGKAKLGLANSLMELGRSSPDTVRGRAVPAVIYDTHSGIRSFVKTLLTIRALETGVS